MTSPDSNVVREPITEDLQTQAREAFEQYERVIVEHILRRPTWRLDATPLFDVLASNDAARARAFISEMRRERDRFSRMNVV